MRFFFVFLIALIFSQPLFASTDQRGLTIRPKAPTGENVKGDQWLLTIGIDNYASWPRLKTAANDAKALKKVLLDLYHFDPANVVELHDENATRKNIIGTLRDLTKKIKPEDSLIIFYAGHGHIDNITKKGSWIPVESGTDDSASWISNQDIKDYLNIDAIKAKHVLLISDSCFSGDFFRGTRSAIPEVTDSVIKKAYQLSSRQAITSGGLEPVSDAGFGGNSVFSHFLITTLKNNNKPYLIPSELFPSIKSGVAQNAEQFPQMGSLYGVGGQDGGELVLFLKQEGRLGDLSAGSEARQKELETLKKAETEAIVVKQKEQDEIARKQAELDALDKQIAEMKGRLGSGTTRSSDSLDAIVTMVERKEQQGQRLEELRKQREAEELKRGQEIERLRKEALSRRNEQIIADIVKYQKIASSKYGQEMKSAAWDALIAAYPEAKKVDRYDVDKFLDLNVTGFGYSDPETALEWAINGNIADKDMNWNEAEKWTKNLNYGGRTNWRLPTKNELVNFIKRCGERPMSCLAAKGFKNVKSGFYWTGSSEANKSWAVSVSGNEGQIMSYKDSSFPVWPVRPKNIPAIESTSAPTEAKKQEVSKALLTYTDPQSGLMWAKNGNIADKKMGWSEAMSWVKSLSYGGYNDWRLPNVFELKDFAKRGGNRPAAWFNANGFSNVQNGWYISATESGWGGAGCVDMEDGADRINTKFFFYYVWPVRDTK